MGLCDLRVGSLTSILQCVVQAVTSHAVPRLPEFATQAVSNTVWGCATLEFYNDEFFEAAAADFMRKGLTDLSLRGRSWGAQWISLHVANPPIMGYYYCIA